MTYDTVRKIIEGKMGKDPELDIAAEINELLSRNYCDEGDAKRLRRNYGIADPTVLGKSELNPVLMVEWGAKLVSDFHLSPKFMITGLDSPNTPLVYFPLDDRIPCEDWNSTPGLSQQDCNHWFHQKLRFADEGQFLFTVTLIDSTPGKTEPDCYQCEFRVNVTSSNEKRTITVTADNVAADLGSLLQGDQNIVLNLQNSAIKASGESPSSQRIARSLQQARDAAPNNEMQASNFLPHRDLAARIPHVNIRDSETALSRAVLHIDGHPVIHLKSGNSLEFGRNDPEKNHFNDVPLEIFPDSDNDEATTTLFSLLNMLFSRNHALLEVTDCNVGLLDCRERGITDGLTLNGQPLDKGQYVRIFSPCTDTGKSQAILFSKMLALQITPYRETVVTGSCRELPESLLSQLYGKNLHHPRSVSAIKITRKKHLEQGERDHAKALQKVLQKDLKEESPAVSQRFTEWLKFRYRDCRFNQEEHLLVVTSATLGGGHEQVMAVQNHDWDGVQLRILNLDDKLYLENTTTAMQLFVVVNGTKTVLKTLRPIPIQSGMVVCTASKDLLHIEGV